MPEQENEEQKTRIGEFIKKYGELVDEFKVDFASFPTFVPDGEGKGGFKVIIQTVPVDTKNQPTKSPFVG